MHDTRVFDWLLHVDVACKSRICSLQMLQQCAQFRTYVSRLSCEQYWIDGIEINRSNHDRELTAKPAPTARDGLQLYMRIKRMYHQLGCVQAIFIALTVLSIVFSSLYALAYPSLTFWNDYLHPERSVHLLRAVTYFGSISTALVAIILIGVNGYGYFTASRHHQLVFDVCLEPCTHYDFTKDRVMHAVMDLIQEEWHELLQEPMRQLFDAPGCQNFAHRLTSYVLQLNRHQRLSNAERPGLHAKAAVGGEVEMRLYIPDAPSELQEADAGQSKTRESSHTAQMFDINAAILENYAEASL